MVNGWFRLLITHLFPWLFLWIDVLRGLGPVCLLGRVCATNIATQAPVGHRGRAVSPFITASRRALYAEAGTPSVWLQHDGESSSQWPSLSYLPPEIRGLPRYTPHNLVHCYICKCTPRNLDIPVVKYVQVAGDRRYLLWEVLYIAEVNTITGSWREDSAPGSSLGCIPRTTANCQQSRILGQSPGKWDVASTPLFNWKIFQHLSQEYHMACCYICYGRIECYGKQNTAREAAVLTEADF